MHVFLETDMLFLTKKAPLMNARNGAEPLLSSTAFPNEFMPKMFGEQIKYMNLILSDRDSQEIDAIDHAIKVRFPYIFRARCGWHLIEQGWKRHMDGSNSYPEECKELFDKVMGI